MHLTYGISWCVFIAIAVCGITKNTLSAQSISPHPWLATAPGEFVRLIDKGNVKIVVDDERVRKAGKTALTLFHFLVDFDVKFRHQAIGFDTPSQTWHFKISYWMNQPKIRLEHTVCFPSSFNPESPWDSKLLKHEFDHVAISTDPRLLILLKRTLQQRHEWIAKFPQSQKPTVQDIRASIHEKVAEDVKTLEQLVQTQYDLLDKESNQGTSVLGQRGAFFKSLYTLEGLERIAFEMDPALRVYVKDKLTSSAVEKELQGHYLFLLP